MPSLKLILLRLEELATTRGTLAKYSTCKQLVKELPNVMVLFEAVYSNTLFGTSKKTFQKAFDDDGVKKYSDPGDMAFELSTGTYELDMFTLDRLLQNAKVLTGNDLIDFLKQEVVTLKPLFAKWIVRVLNKDLRIGLSVDTLNKILDELQMVKIPTFGVQLCGKFTSIEQLENKLSYPLYACCKYDGMRAICKKEGHRVTFTSRQGESIKYVPELVEFFSNFSEDFELDGEIDCGNFSLLSSRIGRKEENINPIESLHFRAYDILSINGNDLREKEYQLRRVMLFSTFKEHGLLKLEESELVTNTQELTEFYEKMVSRGEEGIIVKLLNTPYIEDSRKNMFKLKPIFENSFRIVEAEFGSGKYAEYISTLHVEDKHGVVKSGVGSGLKDEDRELVTRLYKDKELIGRIIDVKYFEVSSNKQGGFGLRFPTFLKFRDDKNEADEVKKREE